MTLIVHNEVDMLDASLRFHYAHGVDHVLAIDDRSADGSTEVLEAHSKAGRLTLVERPPGEMRAVQSRWTTLLARMAKTRYGADWVINSDADEIWWPVHGSLAAGLDQIAPGYDRVLIPRTDFVIADGESLPGTAAEQMIMRERRSPIGLRVAHRGFADIIHSGGNHRVARNSDRVCLAWTESGDKEKPMEIAPSFPIQVFHYPVRSWAQLAASVRDGRNKISRDPVLRTMRQTMRTEELRAMVLAAGPWPPEPRQRLLDDLIRDGRIVKDTRVRDAIGSSKVIFPVDEDEEREIAALVMSALAREDRRLRTRGGRYLHQANDRWPSPLRRLQDRVTPTRLRGLWRA